MHEIITIQLGHQANYVGTHFWNAQEAYFTYDEESRSPIDHNVHFRPGVGAGGVDTFTPRALIYDLKGGFGTMRKVNELYEELDPDGPSEKGLWDFSTATQMEPRLEMIQYQKDLEAGRSPSPLKTSDIRYWSDYNRVYFHPRSSIQLTEYELDSKLQPFERFDFGTDLFHELNREHDLLDRDFRLFVEECDQLQGVQLITSADNGWGGFAAEYVEELRDEYGKTALFTWGIENTKQISREAQLTQQVSLAKTLSRVVASSSVYVPLAYPPVKVPQSILLDRTSQWHTSSLLAAAFETATLRTRFRPDAGGCTMNDVVLLMTAGTGRNLALLSLGIRAPEDCEPTQVNPVQTMEMFECSWNGASRFGKKSRTFSEIDVVRSRTPGLDAPDATGSAKRGDPIINRFHTSLEFPIVDSFPKIFPTNNPTDPLNEKTCGMDTALTTTTSVVSHITELKKSVARAVKVQEREVLLNGLDEIIEIFQDGWNSDSDWDDDL